MSLSTERRVNASRSRDSAMAGEIASAPATSMRSGERVPATSTRQRFISGVAAAYTTALPSRVHVRESVNSDRCVVSRRGGIESVWAAFSSTT